MAQRSSRSGGPAASSAFLLAAAVAACLTAAGCLSPPRPTEEAVLRSGNARALVEGVVRDETGRPVAGIQVLGLPRERDLLWSDAATTDTEGRFQLPLFAPGEYGFLLAWRGVTVITPREDDPSRLRVALVPGEKQGDVHLTWRRAEWEKRLAEAGQTLPSKR